MSDSMSIPSRAQVVLPGPIGPYTQLGTNGRARSRGVPEATGSSSLDSPSPAGGYCAWYTGQYIRTSRPTASQRLVHLLRLGYAAVGPETPPRLGHRLVLGDVGRLPGGGCGPSLREDRRHGHRISVGAMDTFAQNLNRSTPSRSRRVTGWRFRRTPTCCPAGFRSSPDGSPSERNTEP